MGTRHLLPTSRSATRALALLSLLLVVVAAGPLSAAEAGRRRSPDFPVPLVAPVLAPPSLPPELRVAAIYTETDDSTGDDPVVVVEFAETFELPESDYRIAVYAGAPTGDRVRATLRATGGDEEGTFEVGDASGFADAQPTPVRFDGVAARVTIPAGELPEGGGSLWVEVERAGQPPFVTPLFPLDSVLQRGERGSLGAAEVVWAADGLPASLPPSPQLSIDDDILTLTYSAAPPTEVAGTPLANVVDVVRVAASYEEGGQARYQIAVDNAAGQVVLFDTRDGFPVVIEADPSTWLIKGLDGQSAQQGTTIEVDLDGVFEAFDFTPSEEGTALGVARSLTVDASTAVRADGAIATLAWFEGAGAAGPPTVERSSAPETEDPAPDAADSDFPILLVGAIVAILVVAVVAWLLVRRGPRDSDEPPRLRMSLTKHEEPLIVPVEVSVAERDELDRLTNNLFGDANENTKGDSDSDGEAHTDTTGSDTAASDTTDTDTHGAGSDDWAGLASWDTSTDAT